MDVKRNEELLKELLDLKEKYNLDGIEAIAKSDEDIDIEIYKDEVKIYACDENGELEIARFNILEKVMTFAEASEKWGLGESTLRSVVKTNRVTNGVDIKKSGKVWLITENAMKKLYGEPKK